MTGEKEAWTVLGIRVYRFTLRLVFAFAPFGWQFLTTVRNCPSDRGSGFLAVEWVFCSKKSWDESSNSWLVNLPFRGGKKTARQPCWIEIQRDRAGR